MSLPGTMTVRPPLVNFINAKAEHWNVTPKDMVGKTDFDFLPKEQAEHAFNDDKHILETGKSIIDKMEKITGSDGLDRWFSVTKVPRYNAQGKIVGTIGISRNVTEWKKLEAINKEHIEEKLSKNK